MSYIGEEFDIKKLYFDLFGYVAPPFLTLGSLKNQLKIDPLDSIKELFKKNKKTVIGTDILMPLSLRIPNNEPWEIPTEPMISISGGHKITRRYPNRPEKGGSIKERWGSDDFKITVKGVFVNFSGDDYPEEEVKQLRKYCEYNGALEAKNLLLGLFGVTRIVINTYDLPFMQGLRFQPYTLNAWSDQLFDNLLIAS